MASGSKIFVSLKIFTHTNKKGISSPISLYKKAIFAEKFEQSKLNIIAQSNNFSNILTVVSSLFLYLQRRI